MSGSSRTLSRRDFLKLTGLGMGAMAMRRWEPQWSRGLFMPEFPAAERLGRNCTGKIDIKSQPDIGSSTVKTIYEDTVLPWLREVNALNPDYNRIIQRWVETPEGFIYSPYFQPVRNLPNTPLTSLPAGTNGFWAEVTVPYVDFVMDNPPPRSPGLRYLVENNQPTRFYYSQVFWVDQVKTSEVTGNIIYRVSERFGSYGDVAWAEAAAFRPYTEEDSAPIHPEVDPNTKKVVVNLTNQTLSCFEGDQEVYFCRVSTGVGDHSTPLGQHMPWRKMISTHMAGGTVDAGYDTPGIGWTYLFSGEGVAIHSTFWHNQFGERRSHGCVNCSPEDAKWIFRWTTPAVQMDPGDVVVQYPAGGTTPVIVEERLY